MSQRTSAAGDLQVEWSSAVGNLKNEGVPEIKGTSAAAEHTEIKEDPQINSTSAAAEHTAAAAEHTEIKEDPQINSTSAAAEHTEIQEDPRKILNSAIVDFSANMAHLRQRLNRVYHSDTSDTKIEEDPQINSTSAAVEHTEIQEDPQKILSSAIVDFWTNMAHLRIPRLNRVYHSDTSDTEIEEDPQIKGTSAAAEHTESEKKTLRPNNFRDSPWQINSTSDTKIEEDTESNSTSDTVIEEDPQMKSMVLSLVQEFQQDLKKKESEKTTLRPNIFGVFDRRDTEINSTSDTGLYWAEKKTLRPNIFGVFDRRDTEINSTSDTGLYWAEKKTHWPKNSIFRVPQHIKSDSEDNRNSNNTESRFKPKLVSIGPYFHKKENLERMQNLKFRCNEEILKMMGIALTRTNHLMPRPPVDHSPYVVTQSKEQFFRKKDRAMRIHAKFHAEFLQPFMHLANEARDYYKDEFNLEDVNFVKMLFLDSCFIIRTIFAFSQQTQSMSFLDVHIKEVRSDLLLLENQIPLFFIKKVYEWFSNKLKPDNLPDFITVLEPFICLDMPWTINKDAKYSEAAHLLDLYWRYSLPPDMSKKLTLSESYHSDPSSSKIDPSIYIDIYKKTPMFIANATELQQKAGIEFEQFKVEGSSANLQKKKFEGSLKLDVTFSKGIIQMPRLRIDSRQMTLLTNLIVFENCMVPKLRTISYYVKLMDGLINSEKDVELLQNSGVIYNTMSSHKKAAIFFNDIGNFCFTDDNEDPFSSLYEDVQKYYNDPWHRRLASLKHNYFNSSWAGFSFAAALIMLFLSVAQTFYTVYGYHKPKK